MGSKVTVAGKTQKGVEFVTKNMLGVTQNNFEVSILDRGEVRGMSSRITNYKTAQQSIMFIPVTPKQLLGFGAYKAFMEKVSAAVKRADPSAQTEVRER